MTYFAGKPNPDSGSLGRPANLISAYTFSLIVRPSQQRLFLGSETSTEATKLRWELFYTFLPLRRFSEYTAPPRPRGRGRVHLNRVHFPLYCIPPSLVTQEASLLVCSGIFKLSTGGLVIQLSNYPINLFAWLP